MSSLIATPGNIGIDPRRLDLAYRQLQQWVTADRVPAAALCVGRRGFMVEPRFFGRHRPEAGSPALRPDALFLIASPTKPIMCTAIMMLIERGELALQDKVALFVPRFAAKGKEDVTVQHLLTHSSGLPDMLPNNDDLRKAHAPFSAFIDDICALPLLFPPGTQVNYQSMGIAMLAEIVHQVTGSTVAEFLRKEVFQPLGMSDTTLGWQPAQKYRIAAVRVPRELENVDWNWNSPYWLGFGAPWGGLIASPADFGRFCLMMLNGGALAGTRILSAASVRAMTSNQFAGMPQIPEEDRRCRPWGLGWRLNWPGHASSFGDLLGPRAFGHWGATGTMCWLDPDSQAFFVLLTTQPLAEGRQHLTRISNIVTGALL